MNIEIPQPNQQAAEKMPYDQARQIINNTEGLEYSILVGIDEWKHGEDDFFADEPMTFLTTEQIAEMMMHDKKLREAINVYISQVSENPEEKNRYHIELLQTLVDKFDKEASNPALDKNLSQTMD